MVECQFDRYSLILNGKHQLIRCGAMHYFRLPHPDLWWDRLNKLKMAGYNTVDLYFHWGYHSQAPGQYDFSGIRDVGHLLDMVEELGLYLIARPGPYINAETSRGGFPGWLLTQPGVILRNREEGIFRYSPEYMGFVKEWFDQILPFIKPRQNLLMIQVENEYSTVDMEPEYMDTLSQWIREHGIAAPTMHNDFYAAGLYADQVDLYAIDNYSVTVFDLNWRTFPDLFSIIDHLEDTLRPEFCQNRPLMVAELQAGWFAGWKGVPYQVIHDTLGRDHISIVTRSFLGQGGTLFNHYKAIGGTNWDHIGGTDTYTSYDFSAPISETGLATERLYEAKRINLLLASFDLTRTDRVSPETIGLKDTDTLYTVRADKGNPGAHWIFTRNLTETPGTFELSPGVSAAIPPHSAMMLPVRVPLQKGWTLNAMNAEPLAQTPNALLVPGQQPLVLDLKVTPDFSPHTSPGVYTTTPLEDQTFRIQLNHPVAETEYLAIPLAPDYTLYVLGAMLADRVWPIGQNRFIIGPDLVRSETEAFLSTPRPCLILEENGVLTALADLQAESYTIPGLDEWSLQPGAAPLWDSNGYRPISPLGSDMDQNGLYEGAAWYRYEFEGPASRLSLHAQHIWAVFLNGTCLTAQHTFHVHPDKTGPQDEVTIHLPQDLQHTDRKNVLVIFTESLGHHKGFFDDTREPRGVLSLNLDGRDMRCEGKIREAALQPDSDSALSGQTLSPVLYASTSFTLGLPDSAIIPMGLLVDLDIERVNITLNGVLLGKYWRSCKNQTTFYLPEGILNPHGLNHLVLTLIDFFPLPDIENPFPKRYGRVSLQPFQELFKLSL